MYVERLLSLTGLNNSHFIFGCRQTGKTEYITKKLEYDLYINLLKTSDRLRYEKDPGLIYDEVKALRKNNAIIVIDEIQKIPFLLDEIHRSIESEMKPSFILTGSSGRKLKKTHANLLGGRAFTNILYPFSYLEIESRFNLDRFLKYGGLPKVFLSDEARTKEKLLNSYIETYLKEEVAEESRSINLPAFSQFLDFAAFENGNILNFSTLAPKVGVSPSVIKSYFEILQDTYLGFLLPAFSKSVRKRIISNPKFYFVDPGFVFALKKMLTVDLKPETQLYGDAFEHFIILETMKLIRYTEQEISASYFRTYDETEVDLILERHGEIVPIEIKSSDNPRKLKGLYSFISDHKCKKAFCVCRTPRSFERDGIHFIPWQDYLTQLFEKRLYPGSDD